MRDDEDCLVRVGQLLDDAYPDGGGGPYEDVDGGRIGDVADDDAGIAQRPGRPSGSRTSFSLGVPVALR